jgi:hypothetical protein
MSYTESYTYVEAQSTLTNAQVLDFCKTLQLQAPAINAHKIMQKATKVYDLDDDVIALSNATVKTIMQVLNLTEEQLSCLHSEFSFNSSTAEVDSDLIFVRLLDDTSKYISEWEAIVADQ